MTGGIVVRTRTGQRRRHLHRHTAITAQRVAPPPGLLLPPPLLAGGAALLAWDYAAVPEGAVRYVLYWLALGMALAGAWLAAVSGRPGLARQAVALAGFGAVTWLPYLLRSPDRLLFIDERYHLDVLLRIAETGGTQLQPRLYALPGSFPGLEDVTLALMAWTGLPAEVATRFVTLPAHAVIPVLALVIAREMGLPAGLAALSAIVYSANTSYLFFHSVFSYETLGIVLYLATWAVVIAWLRARDARPSRLLLPALPLVAAITVTHHLSSYLLAVGLGVGALVLWRQRHPGAGALAVLAVATGTLAAAWFALNAAFLGPYVVGTLTERLRVIADTLFADRSQPRTLFANSPLPLPERAIAFLYPVLVLGLGAVGVLAAVRLRRRGRLRSPAWAILAIVGPLGWLTTTPAVVTRSGELAYRSWPFLFLGVAPFVALGMVAGAGWLARRVGRAPVPATAAPPRQTSAVRPRLATAAPPLLAALLLVGGFTIGDNQAGRFPVAQPATAAGPANATDDLLAAAHWLRATAGEDHLVATDSGSAVTFSTDGAQRILRWNSWYPFLVDDPAQILPFLIGTRTEYLVVDLQVTQLPPRYSGYYGPPAIPPARDPGQPIPAALLQRLDQVSGLQRVYDSGRIRIYAVGTR